MKHVKKAFRTLSLAALMPQEGGNTIAGVASAMGVPDRGARVIFPGAFRDCAAAFLTNGFVPIGHNWSDNPVAMPTVCQERGRDLYVEAEFHTTPLAAETKTVVSERLAKGLKVGLSIGWASNSENWAWFETGRKLLDWAAGLGHDLSGFDTAAIEKLGDCRGYAKVDELYEWSIVTIPMNRDARAVALKAILEGDDLSLAERFDAALGAADDSLKRLEGLVALRSDEGKRVSRERIEQARTLASKLASIADAASTTREDKDLAARMIARTRSARALEILSR